MSHQGHVERGTAKTLCLSLGVLISSSHEFLSHRSHHVKWGAAKKLDLRGVELGGKCTYTSEHVLKTLALITYYPKRGEGA